ncbi:MAG: hypothetical protein GX785_13410 [Armatimonadetes bacterium]|nr:hypothetical protein [Armatimonadota bacterium]
MKNDWGRADWSRVFYVSLVFAIVLVPAALIHVLYRHWGVPAALIPTVWEAPWFEHLVVVFAFMSVVVAWISSRKARESPLKPEPALESSPRVEPWRAESLQEEWNGWERKLDTYRWILDGDLPALDPGELSQAQAAFNSLREGIERLQDPGDSERPRANVPDRTWVRNSLETGISAILDREEERQRLRALVEKTVTEFREQVETLREEVRVLQREAGVPAEEAEGPGESDSGAGHLASLQEKIGELQRRVEALAGESADETSGAGADVLQTIDGRLSRITDALEARAYEISIRDFHRRHEEFTNLRRRLAGEVLPLLETAPGDEAARHCHRALSELLERLDGRLAAAKEAVRHRGETPGGGGELERRIERLETRAHRLKDGGDACLMELAEPLVQEHLRPLVEMIIRDFLRPLLEEATPVEGETARSARATLLGEVVTLARRVLLESIQLEVIDPKAGSKLEEEAHDEIEVLAPEGDASPNTVAEVVAPGYRWAGEVIQRARVCSYRERMDRA